MTRLWDSLKFNYLCLMGTFKILSSLCGTVNLASVLDIKENTTAEHKDSGQQLVWRVNSVGKPFFVV